MKKSILTILIIFVLYILLVFVAPGLADKVGWAIWLQWFNDIVRDLKKKWDETITNYPQIKEDVENRLSEAQSGALELKNTVAEGVKDTKEKIDTVRETLEDTRWSIEETVNSINNTVDKVWELSDSVKWVVSNSSGDTVNSIGQTCLDSWDKTNIYCNKFSKTSCITRSYTFKQYSWESVVKCKWNSTDSVCVAEWLCE